ncbi:MAG TPA: primosomal protein N' [Candidatus Cybelea sp.]|nr:primosomal protein N' [Candidatus Cybelea sp.]
MRAVDALPAIRSSRFDLPLTYDAGGLELAVGDVVRIPLGKRDVLGFIVSPVRDVDDVPGALKEIRERLEVPRAFDETGLRLARFVADQYLCTLGEALGAVVLGGAVPRIRDTLVRSEAPATPARYPSVPDRLLRLIWEEFDESFTLESLLRHPEARRAADRTALLAHIRTLVRADSLRRVRRIVEPRLRERRRRAFEPAEGRVEGKKAQALAAFVRARPGVGRAEALLAGYSNGVIARAIAAGAVREVALPVQRARGANASPEAVMLPTPDQAVALQSIEAALARRRFETALLYGITGSGKTYVYVEAIQRVLRDGGRAIVLVPEISLTPQTAARFEAAFGDRVAVLHSALSERERFDAWAACTRGAVDVVVGARSAVFAPLSDVRLTIVDESHDPSYKQEVVPRYHAVAVAAARMRLQGGMLLLGSATPSLESYAAAKAGRIALLEMRKRATAQPLPAVEIVDLRAEFESGNHAIFSDALVQALGDRLQRDEKSILFVNRRGSAGALICRTCGTSPHCRRCSIALSVHRAEGLLRCHYCDFQMPIVTACPTCGARTIAPLGIGTERVADEVARLFPEARVMRMDSDTTTRVGDHARILTAFDASGDVLVGTQMVAKGLDYPTVTLAGVVAADLGLNLPDFRAAERSFALIAQVCGRSGRGRRGEAIVQTYSPEHPAIAFAAQHDYDGFAALELRERTALGFPPARRLVYIGVIGRERARVAAAAARYAEILREPGLAEVLGPAPYPVARVNDEWRYRIALKTAKPKPLRAFIRERLLPAARVDAKTRLAINVDP